MWCKIKMFAKTEKDYLSMNFVITCNDSRVAKSKAAAMWESPNAAAMNTEPKETICLPLEGLKVTQGSPERPSPPLPTLKWGLKGADPGSTCPITQYIACTWAPLGWPCLPTRCSITASGCDLALPLQHHTGLPFGMEQRDAPSSFPFISCHALIVEKLIFK